MSGKHHALCGRCGARIDTDDVIDRDLWMEYHSCVLDDGYTPPNREGGSPQ